MLRRQLENKQLRTLSIAFFLLALWIVARLFWLQAVQHSYYALFALNAHEIYQKTHPHRGNIYFQDTRSQALYPAAVNKDFFMVYAVPKEIAPRDVKKTFDVLTNLLTIDDDNRRHTLFNKLAQSELRYVPVAKKVAEEDTLKIKEAGLTGVYFTQEEYRYYPEKNSGANVLGFVGSDASGDFNGRYGLEGYWDKELAGKGGFLEGEKGAQGNLISLADKKIVPAEDGIDLVLTIDRALQYKACERLRQGMDEYQAKSAALLLLNPTNGAVLAMCSLPDFDPNEYSKTEDIAAFNNTSIFTQYEPGSVFKAFTMAAGLDLNLITPETTYTDPCERIINKYHIRNAQQKCYGVATMTNVLENSINTGAVWVEEQIGGERFNDYIKKFGFGQKTGIELNTESAGDISSLGRKGAIFGANGSFGQGLTATPLQLASAYGAIANDGKLLKPYVVGEKRYANGRRERTSPEVVDVAISPQAARLTSAMLVSVVENHYHAAKIDHYYVAGKTGTAQIPEKGSYSDTRTNHTFAGFAPADKPQLVLVVKYEEPQRKWAEQTALPVFKDVMKFALTYYGIPGTRWWSIKY